MLEVYIVMLPRHSCGLMLFAFCRPHSRKIIVKNDPKVVIYLGSPNRIVRLSQLSLLLTTRKVQTSLCLFLPTAVSNCTSSNLGCRQQHKKRPERGVLYQKEISIINAPFAVLILRFFVSLLLLYNLL